MNYTEHSQINIVKTVYVENALLTKYVLRFFSKRKVRGCRMNGIM